MKTEDDSLFHTNPTPPRRAWRRWLAVAASSFAATSLMAATATIYSNDFEAYPTFATSLADEATDADPVGAEWNMADDAPLGAADGSGVQVINWLQNSVGSPTKALLLRSGTQAQIYLRDARSGSRYQLDFWVFSVKTPPANRGWYVLIRGEGSDINGDDYLAYQSLRDNTANTIRYYDGVGPGAGAWINTGLQHATNAWQHHRIVIDPNALTFDVYLDDMVTPVLTGGDISRSEVGVPTIIQLLHEGNSADDGYCVFDDIRFTVEDSKDLTTTFTEGFESYSARVNPDDDADPAGPWITTEVDGTGTGRLRAPGKVQVVSTSVVTPHTGTKCLKLEAGQRAGSSIAWGTPPQADVQITWWARVPASIANQTANYLRMSLYGAENGNTVSGDNALLGYGSRQPGLGDETSITYFTTAWVDSGVDYTPDVWEEYRLTTHTSQGIYTIIKNPSSASPQVIVDRMPLIGTAITDWKPVLMAAWSSSNGTNHPPVFIDDIEIRSLVAIAQPFGPPYTPTIDGSRFTNFTQLVVAGTPVGRPIVDPRDNTTILCAVDAPPPAGGIYRATKVASGNWAVDPTPIVAGLDRPSGLAITADGTLWWTHDYNNDYTRSVGRLKWPWASNAVETVIADLVDPAPAEQDDDAIDLCVAPSTFTGTIGRPGWIVVADRGVNGNNRNGVYVIDPATPELNQTNYSTFLINPTQADLGGDLTAIAALPQSGEVVVVSVDGFLVAINGDGTFRYLNSVNLWPIGAPANGAAIATDPVTGRLWAADDTRDEVWSIDVATGVDQKEISFPLNDASRPDRQMDFHDPGMAFAPDGSFLVVSDTSTVNGGGRLLIFHKESIGVPTFAILSVSRVAQGVQLNWQPAGSAQYDVLRGADLANAASFVSIATNLTTTTFTDTNAPAGAAFYRVVAKP